MQRFLPDFRAVESTGISVGRQRQQSSAEVNKAGSSRVFIWRQLSHCSAAVVFGLRSHLNRRSKSFGSPAPDVRLSGTQFGRRRRRDLRRVDPHLVVDDPAIGTCRVDRRGSGVVPAAAARIALRRRPGDGAAARLGVPRLGDRRRVREARPTEGEHDQVPHRQGNVRRECHSLQDLQSGFSTGQIAPGSHANAHR